MTESNFMSPPSPGLLSWLLDRVLASVFAYIMLKGARKITRHQETDQLAIDAGGSQPNRTLVQVGILGFGRSRRRANYFGSPVRF